MKPAVSVIICTYNEAENLPYVLPRIPDWVDEILLVDGHSTDGTVDIARQLTPRIRITYQDGKGKANALAWGFKHAAGDILVTMDADGSDDPALLEKFIAPLLEGFDFVKGSRFPLGHIPRGVKFHRVVGNRFLASLVNLLLETNYTDVCSGYNAFWKSVVARIPGLVENTAAAEPSMYIRIAKAGLRVTEVYHDDEGRIHGRSHEGKYSFIEHGFRTLRYILKEAKTPLQDQRGKVT